MNLQVKPSPFTLSRVHPGSNGRGREGSLPLNRSTREYWPVRKRNVLIVPSFDENESRRGLPTNPMTTNHGIPGLLREHEDEVRNAMPALGILTETAGAGALDDARHGKRIGLLILIWSGVGEPRKTRPGDGAPSWLRVVRGPRMHGALPEGGLRWASGSHEPVVPESLWGRGWGCW